MYAIVRAGGRQFKVAVGDEVEVNALPGEPGSALSLPAVLLVDGDAVTTDAAALADATVTAEVVGHGKGPKIRIHRFRSKSRQHRRQGHRQPLTRLRVTEIQSGK